MKRFFVFVLVLFLCVSDVGRAESVRKTRFGTTFSAVQCEYFGMDWEETYEKVLGMGFSLIRLGAYWRDIERQEGSYDFRVLDSQISGAKKAGIPIVLVVGMKSPRWPEYFLPEWLEQEINVPGGTDIGKIGLVRKKVKTFIRKVIERYESEDAILYWQVENEPLDKIGEKGWYIGSSLLIEEVALVRELDSKKRKILLTAATYPNMFIRFLARYRTGHDPIREVENICDILGLNVYPMFGHRAWGLNFYFRTTPKEFENYFRGILFEAKKKKKPVWITELQAEPWEAGHLVYRKKEPPRTGDIATFKKTYKALKDLGVDTFLLWGVEYWIYRRETYGDRSWLEEVSGIIEKDAR